MKITPTTDIQNQNKKNREKILKNLPKYRKIINAGHAMNFKEMLEEKHAKTK